MTTARGPLLINRRMRATPTAVCIRHSCESISLFLCVCSSGHESTGQPSARYWNETGTKLERTRRGVTVNIYSRGSRKTRCERVKSLWGGIHCDVLPRGTSSNGTSSSSSLLEHAPRLVPEATMILGHGPPT